MLSLVPATLLPATYKKRRLAHGLLMLASVLLMGVNAPDTRVAGICCGGVVLLYVTLKCTGAGVMVVRRVARAFKEVYDGYHGKIC